MNQIPIEESNNRELKKKQIFVIEDIHKEQKKIKNAIPAF